MNKNNIAAAVLTSKVESFPVCSFSAHGHVARAGDGDRGKRRGRSGLFILGMYAKKLLPDGIPKRFVFVL